MFDGIKKDAGVIIVRDSVYYCRLCYGDVVTVRQQRGHCVAGEC